MTAETEEDLVGFAARQRLLSHGLPFPMTWGPRGAYLAAWTDRPTTVGKAAAAAGVTPAVIRQWRARHPEFKAAERALRQGVPYRLDDAQPEPKREPDPTDRYRLHETEPLERPIPRPTRWGPPPWARS